MKLQGTMSKLLGHVFAQIDGVVWDGTNPAKYAAGFKIRAA